MWSGFFERLSPCLIFKVGYSNLAPTLRLFKTFIVHNNVNKKILSHGRNYCLSQSLPSNPNVVLWGQHRWRVRIAIKHVLLFQSVFILFVKFWSYSIPKCSQWPYFISEDIRYNKHKKSCFTEEMDFSRTYELTS